MQVVAVYLLAGPLSASRVMGVTDPGLAHPIFTLAFDRIGMHPELPQPRRRRLPVTPETQHQVGG